MLIFTENQLKGTKLKEGRQRRNVQKEELSEFVMEIRILKLGIRYLSRMRGDVRIVTHWRRRVHMIEMALARMWIRIIVLIPLLIMWNWTVWDGILRLHILKMQQMI